MCAWLFKSAAHAHEHTATLLLVLLPLPAPHLLLLLLLLRLLLLETLGPCLGEAVRSAQVTAVSPSSALRR